MLEDLIRERAYNLFEARGGEFGHDLEDWFQAEREVLEAMEAAQGKDPEIVEIAMEVAAAA